jgi:protein NUD1
MSRITETDREKEDVEVDDEEEMELTSFSFDGPSAGVVHVMTGVEDMSTDSEDEDDHGLATEAGGHEYEHELGDGFDSDEELPEALQAPPAVHAFSTPRAQPQTPLPARGVMKSTSNTPVSALKNGSGRNHNRTPANRNGHRRSVSFSDGKREGPIRGVGRNAGDVGNGVHGEKDTAIVHSVRSKRIADMMQDLENQGNYRGAKVSSGPYFAFVQ